MNTLPPLLSPTKDKHLFKKILLLLSIATFSALAIGTEINAITSAHTKTSGTWTPTESMNNFQISAKAALLPDGNVLVTGGFDPYSGPLHTAELYHPHGAWTRTGSMNDSHTGHTITLLPHGKVLVAGGNSQGTAELYDSIRGVWTRTGSMHSPRQNHTATLLPNGKVLITGGSNHGNNGYYLKTAELYNPKSGEWTSAKDMIIEHGGHTATLLTNGKVLIVGGYNPSNRPELYDPINGDWIQIKNIPQWRYHHTATLLSNGLVLVAGGYSLNKDGILIALNTAELYDPNHDKWTSTGIMNIDRADHTATLLPDNSVLIAGGNNRYVSVNSADRYNPKSNVWEAAGFIGSRENHTATLMQNGKVLVAGGSTRVPVMKPLKTAELFTPDENGMFYSKPTD